MLVYNNKSECYLKSDYSTAKKDDTVGTVSCSKTRGPVFPPFLCTRMTTYMVS